MLIRCPSVQNIASLIDDSHFLFHMKLDKLVYLLSNFTVLYSSIRITYSGMLSLGHRHCGLQYLLFCQFASTCN